jgi:hypothetical protein
MHRRGDYRVDGFALHTGPTEAAVFRRQDDEAGVVYQRLLTPIVLVTCVDCFADERLRRRHRSWAYPVD